MIKNWKDRKNAEQASIHGFSGWLWFYTVRRTVRGPTSAEILLFWPPASPWTTWSYAVFCSLSISWWDYNVSITFVAACGLPTLALSYGLFSHHCIPQARGMCSLFPQNGTRCSRETDRDTKFNRADEPEFDPCTELGTHRRDWLQTDCKVIRYSRYERGRVSKEWNALILVLSSSLTEWLYWPQWTQQISMEAFGQHSLRLTD